MFELIECCDISAITEDGVKHIGVAAGVVHGFCAEVHFCLGSDLWEVEVLMGVRLEAFGDVSDES